MDFLGISLGNHFSQLWSSWAGTQKEGPVARPGGESTVGHEEGGIQREEMNPFSHTVSFAFTTITPFVPTKPFQSHVYVSAIQIRKLRFLHIC